MGFLFVRACLSHTSTTNYNYNCCCYHYCCSYCAPGATTATTTTAATTTATIATYCCCHCYYYCCYCYYYHCCCRRTITATAAAAATTIGRVACSSSPSTRLCHRSWHAILAWHRLSSTRGLRMWGMCFARWFRQAPSMPGMGCSCHCGPHTISSTKFRRCCRTPCA